MGKTAHNNLQHRNNVIIFKLEKVPRMTEMCVLMFSDGRYSPRKKTGLAALWPSFFFSPPCLTDVDF